MTTLITGATGVVGGAVLRHVAEQEDDLRALVRSEEGAAAVSEWGATPVRGDITDPSILPEAMDGVDLVYHVAGLNLMCPRRPERLVEVNVDGAVNVVRAARRAGVRRLVFTSSAAVLGEARGQIGNEDSVHRGAYLSHYDRSKHLGEQAVAAEAGDMEVVMVNPSSVQGPGRRTGDRQADPGPGERPTPGHGEHLGEHRGHRRLRPRTSPGGGSRGAGAALRSQLVQPAHPGGG